MRKRILWTSILATTAAAIAGGLALASDDDGYRGYWRELRDDVAFVTDATYAKECGACHFAYQPGLLPARSWRRLMGGLDDHFGDDATLDDATRERLTGYLVENAADRSDYRRSLGIERSLGPDDAPLRITETPYFIHKHDEVPWRLVRDNPEVRSFSNCTGCHPRAEAGSYDEDEIRIAGFGRWDD